VSLEEVENIMMRILARPQHLCPSPVAPGGLDAHVALVPLAQLCDQLHASEHGLTQAEAQERLLASGPNEPVAHRQGHGMRHMLAFATNPLVVILLLASLVSGLLHDVANATIIALMVLLSMVLNVVQTYRSQQAAERLRDEVAPTAAVLRDGTWSDLPRRDLVPGDVI
jgi:Mg2+-importing ATPase